MLEILKDADNRGDRMESAEAKKIAVQDVMASMVKDEQGRILGLMEEALSKVDEEFHARLAESKDMEEKLQELNERHSSIIITRAARIWLARLSIMRKCKQTFEKIFDEKYHSFYYSNRITVRH